MEYLRLADRVEHRIRSGELPPGTRLPTQRGYAKQEGIAASTAARVYRELVRRGLVTGEVGRGTFVRATPPPEAPALTDPAPSGVHLDLNFAVLPDQGVLVGRAVAALAAEGRLDRSLTPVGPSGTATARRAVAELPRGGWSAPSQQVSFTGNGRQAIAAAVAALVPPGGQLGVEAFTYPVVRGIADRLGVRLVPLPVDDEGLRDDALAERCAEGGLDAVYLQPTLHNPLGVTMGDARRRRLARVLVDHDLVAVEDVVYGFLAPDAPPPLAAHAPDHVVLVDSFSKRFSPGLTLGLLVTPPRLRDAVARTSRSGGWSPPRFALEVITRLLADGVVDQVVADKRRDAVARQRLVAEHLPFAGLRTDPRAYHCWWRLPSGWRADLFIAVAARRGIAVTPGEAFAVTPGAATDVVRLALSSPSLPALGDALAALGAIARGDPAAHGIE